MLDHVGREEVDVAVSIHIAEIDGHARVARLAQRERGRESKGAFPVVQPELVGVLEVVAHIQVARSVAVHVVEPGRQREVIRLGSKGAALLIEKSRARHWLAREVAAPIVDEEEVGLGPLGTWTMAPRSAILDAELGGPAWLGLGLVPDFPHHSVDGEFLRRIAIENALCVL